MGQPFLNILFAVLISTPFLNSVSAASRKCPVFECLPYLLATDIGKISKMFNYESLIGITTQDDTGIEDRQQVVHDVCTSYLRFDNCFGGSWWECFDIVELLQVAKEAFTYLNMPGGPDLQLLTEQQVITGLKVATFVCHNWDHALNNSYCIRSSFVRNSTIYNYFVQAGFDMSHRPQTITCDRFRNLFHIFVYGLASNCNNDLANATNTVLTMSMLTIPQYNLSECNFMTFEEIMAKKPDLSILAKNKTTENGTTTTTAKTTQRSLLTTLLSGSSTPSKVVASTVPQTTPSTLPQTTSSQTVTIATGNLPTTASSSSYSPKPIAITDTPTTAFTVTSSATMSITSTQKASPTLPPPVVAATPTGRTPTQSGGQQAPSSTIASNNQSNDTIIPITTPTLSTPNTTSTSSIQSSTNKMTETPQAIRKSNGCGQTRQIKAALIAASALFSFLFRL